MRCPEPPHHVGGRVWQHTRNADLLAQKPGEGGKSTPTHRVRRSLSGGRRLVINVTVDGVMMSLKGDERRSGSRRLWFVTPLHRRSRLRQVKGVKDVWVGSDDLHRVVDDERGGLVPLQYTRRERPGRLELLDVLRVDLVQPTVSGTRLVLSGHDPLIVIELELQGIWTDSGLLRSGWGCVCPKS
jgi:hypothetical protein